ncbi:MAG: TolC family protein [Bacteroidota bacterium]
MKKIKNKIPLVLMLSCLLIESCKTTKTIESNVIKPIPESFANTKDSANSATINWKKYFSDPVLSGLIDTALKNNLDLLMIFQRIEMSRADVRLAKGLLFPMVDGLGVAGQRKFGNYTMDWAGNSTTEITPGQLIPMHLQDYYLGLQTSWEIDVFGKLQNKKKAAFARYLGSIEGRNWTLTNLVAEIATTYYELLALDNELDIIRETIKLQQDALDIISVQKQTGAANELAVKQFKAQLLNSKTLEIEVLQNITESESKINFLLGTFPKPIDRDKSSFTQLIPEQVKVGIPSDLLKNRPDIKQAEFDLMASKANVKAARAAFYPSLNITGSLGFQAFNTSFLFLSPQSVAYNLFGNLTAPLINRSAIEAEFRTAKANQTEAMYNYQKTIINGYVEVYNEMANIKNMEQIHQFRSQQVDVLTQSIETSSELFKTGRANYLEVLMTQQNALQSKLELVDAKKRQYNAVVNIYKALGGGWR